MSWPSWKDLSKEAGRICGKPIENCYYVREPQIDMPTENLGEVTPRQPRSILDLAPWDVSVVDELGKSTQDLSRYFDSLST